MSRPEPSEDLVTITQIAEITGAARPTVSNWKRRHPDFPAACGQGDRGPLFRRNEVLDWLITNGKLVAPPPVEAATDPHTAWKRALSTLWDQVPRAVAAEAGLALLADAELPADLPRQVAQRVEPLRETITQMPSPDRRLAAVNLIDEAAAGNRSGLADLTTQTEIRPLMVGLLGNRRAVYDPASGAGTLLVASAVGENAPALFGEEINEDAVRLSNLYLRACGLEADIRIGDTLSEDLFGAQQFDGIVAQPPFGVRLKDQRLNPADQRWIYEFPGRAGEVAWIQHVLHHLEAGGRAVVLVPAAFLFDSGPASRLRTSMIRAGQVRAVVQLPPGALVTSSLTTAVLVLEKTPASDRPTVLIGAPDLGQPRGSFLWLDPRRTAEAVGLIRSWLDGNDVELPGGYVEADIEQLAAEGFSLDPRRLVAPPAVAIPDLSAAVAAIEVTIAEASDFARRYTDRFPELLATLPSQPEATPRVPLASISGITVERGLRQTTLVKEGVHAVHTVGSLFGGQPPARFLAPDDERLAGSTPKYNVFKGDLLVALEGPTGYVGRAVVVKEDTFASAQFAVVRDRSGPNAHGLSDLSGVYFLAQWFQTPEAVSELHRLTTGINLPRISLRDFRSFPVPYPSPEARERLSRLYSLVEAAKHWLAHVEQLTEELDAAAALVVAAALPAEDSASGRLRSRGEARRARG